MKYRQLGRSGLKVSEICLGTMTFGHGTDEREAERIVDRAIRAGINFFDTANSYADAQSEIFLGKALKGGEEMRSWQPSSTRWVPDPTTPACPATTS